jgi:glycosyltransferase involved in cell wall biosynthesis
MKTALIHEWLVAEGGAEKVLNTLYELYPSPIYTLVNKGALFEGREIRHSFIQHLPRAAKWYRFYLPLFPLAIEQFDLKDFDCVISLSHAVAKGVLTHAHQLHLCYCFTPMRYLWDQYHLYLKSFNFLSRQAARLFFHSLRKWDLLSAHRVDHFAAISTHVARRIAKIYRREATVIYPPVQTHRFQLAAKKEAFYLTVSRLVPYKRVEMIVETFASLPDKKLIVIGDGPELNNIKAKAAPNVEILGAQSQEVVSEMMAKAKAFLFAAHEDFGISVVEAQAAGTPVIALGKGGALETICDQTTGLFFPEPTPACLKEALFHFEKMEELFDPRAIKDHAERFSEENFKREFSRFVEEKLNAFYSCI